MPKGGRSLKKHGIGEESALDILRRTHTIENRRQVGDIVSALPHWVCVRCGQWWLYSETFHSEVVRLSCDEAMVESIMEKLLGELSGR
jgi:hypothetical protein